MYRGHSTEKATRERARAVIKNYANLDRRATQSALHLSRMH